MISRNNIYIYDHSNKTSFEHIGLTNIPYNDITTNNNIFHPKKLSTNISMHIHFDKQNNNVAPLNVTGDDHS
ncbi:erythrocyte membrane protein 1 (PfEMP1), truncated, putative, partial [Plasmodium reichenowi]